jgi:plastocyanin
MRARATLLSLSIVACAAFAAALARTSPSRAAPPVPGIARADPADAAGSTGEVARLRAEVDRLRQEVRDERELILQLMQAEQQRYDVLLRYLRASGLPDPPPAPPPAGMPGLIPPGRPGTKEPGGEGAAAAHDDAGDASKGTATITGRVRMNGTPVGEAYVYVEGRIQPLRNHTVEIKQRGKQFSPRVVVAQVGTELVFPNHDTVIHNVFSTTPGSAFDLGSIKGGSSTSPVALTRPGPLEIYCNIHSKMRADVLVVPNGQYARVAADGTFQISGVPVGSRRVVLWGPTLKPVRQHVDVTAKGGAVTLTSEAIAVRPHYNKRGQAYGSYDE